MFLFTQHISYWQLKWETAKIEQTLRSTKLLLEYSQCEWIWALKLFGMTLEKRKKNTRFVRYCNSSAKLPRVLLVVPVKSWKSSFIATHQPPIGWINTQTVPNFQIEKTKERTHLKFVTLCAVVVPETKSRGGSKSYFVFLFWSRNCCSNCSICGCTFTRTLFHHPNSVSGSFKQYQCIVQIVSVNHSNCVNVAACNWRTIARKWRDMRQSPAAPKLPTCWWNQRTGEHQRSLLLPGRQCTWRCLRRDEVLYRAWGWNQSRGRLFSQTFGWTCWRWHQSLQCAVLFLTSVVLVLVVMVVLHWLHLH